MDNKWT